MSQSPATTLVPSQDTFVRAATLEDVQAHPKGHLVNLEGHVIVLFESQQQIYAIDNRCPHMGFPLQGGPCKDGIVTCPWHYARFDLASGGTFDSWADDVRAYPIDIRAGDVWVNLAPQTDALTHHRQRLQDGLEQQISLVIAKATIALLDLNTDPASVFHLGLVFGSRHNKHGWGAGLSILTCLMNLMPHLDPEDRPRALYQGLAAVARESAGAPPHYVVHPLPNQTPDGDTLNRWFQQFIERRDREAAERCLVTALATGCDRLHIASMLFTAATEHRYLDGGHTLDFINKALEALDAVNWQDASIVLASIIPSLVNAARKEESNAWRYPVDLVEILEAAFAKLPGAIAAGETNQGTWLNQDELVPILLGDDPQAIADGLLNGLAEGCPQAQLAQIVTYASALRVARFNTNNDHRDWNSAHHPFTYANAVHQAIQRVPSLPLVRGIFDAAMGVYLNRFLNVPPARLPETSVTGVNLDSLLETLPDLLDRQQQVSEVGKTVALYLHSGGNPQRLMAHLAKLALRENRDFHVIQELEAAFRQYSSWGDTPAGIHCLVAAARYLAAHAPTMRSQNQTYEIAVRLHRGDRIFEDSE